MFKCDFCSQNVAEKVKATKIITKLREKFYKLYESWGWEIVEEKFACPTCRNTKKAVSVPPPPSRPRKQKPIEDDYDEYDFYPERVNQRRRKNYRRKND